MSKSSKKRVLVVDDDVVLQSTIKECVERYGFECVVASDGRWALTVLETEPIDLLITDISMPDIDGLELLESIRKEKSLPVIMMTAFAADAEMNRARELGISAFLNKPFRCSQLMEEVNKILKK